MKILTVFFGLLFLSCYDSRDNLQLANNHRAPQMRVQHITNNDIMRRQDADYTNLKSALVDKFKYKKPLFFSCWQRGLIKYINTKEKIVALTFDACGTPGGKGLDRQLIHFLTENKIPATLFLSGIWLDYNPDSIKSLCDNALFDIGNHGLLHRPLSVTGLSKYKIQGTRNVGEAVDEILLNTKKIEHLCSKRPIFFRSGTAFYDDVAVKLIYELKHIPINFSISPGDFDSKTTEWQLAYRIAGRVRNGSIILMHMNRPNGKTFKAVKIVVDILKKRGYRFVKLNDYINHLRD